MRGLEAVPWAPQFVAGILLAFLPGCSRVIEPDLVTAAGSPAAESHEAAVDPLAQTQVSPGWAYYPLAIGNRWLYAYEVRDWIVPNGGSPELIRDIRSRAARWQMCAETLLGTPYVVEQHVVDQVDWYGIAFNRYRQDPSGLYLVELAERPDCPGPASEFPSRAAHTPERQPEEKSLAQNPGPARDALQAARNRLGRRLEGLRSALGLPPAAEPETRNRRGSARAGEAMLLRYPLRAGATWTIRDLPRIVAIVEGLEMLDLPVGRVHGWRIRIQTEEIGDRVHAWYGRSGMLAFRLHAESEVTDGEGHRIATLLHDESYHLRVMMLAGAR